MAKSTRYIQVRPSIWRQAHFQQVMSLGPKTSMIAWYLMTAPMNNICGLFEATLYDIERFTHLSESDIEEALNGLEQLGFCAYDWDKQYVWEKGFIQRQFGNNPSERQLKGVVNTLIRLYEEEAPFIRDVAHHLTTLYPDISLDGLLESVEAGLYETPDR